MSRSAFTLVELLVVVAIIAVLAAMLLPAVGILREQSRTVICMGSHRQMALGLVAFAMDNHGSAPGAGNNLGPDNWAPTFDTRGIPGGSNGILVDREYLPRKTMQCPAAVAIQGDAGTILHGIVGQWGYHYTSANICFVGQQTDAATGEARYYGNRATSLTAALSPPGQTVLTCDRFMWVSYTDTAFIDGSGQVSANRLHRGLTTAVVSYVDGHVGTCSATRPAANPCDGFWVPSWLPFTGGVTPGP